MHLLRTERLIVITTLSYQQGLKTFLSEKEVWIICNIPYQLIAHFRVLNHAETGTENAHKIEAKCSVTLDGAREI